MKIIKLQFGTLITLLIFFSVGIYSCKDDSDDNDTVITTQDRNFAMNTSNSNFTEIQFGHLAIQKATRDSIVAFANGMINDHTKAQRQLDSIARNLNIAVSDSMDATHKTLYDSMVQMSGPGFDSIYIHNQVLDHQLTLELLQDQIDNGNNEMLKDYARKQVPIVTLHLKAAGDILTSISHEGQNP